MKPVTLGCLSRDMSYHSQYCGVKYVKYLHKCFALAVDFSMKLIVMAIRKPVDHHCHSLIRLRHYVIQWMFSRNSENKIAILLLDMIIIKVTSNRIVIYLGPLFTGSSSRLFLSSFLAKHTSLNTYMVKT